MPSCAARCRRKRPWWSCQTGEEIWIVDLITLAGFANTNGEARRFIKGGAVRLGGEVVRDEKLSLRSEDLEGKVLQVGKRRYARLASKNVRKSV